MQINWIMSGRYFISYQSMHLEVWLKKKVDFMMSAKKKIV